MINYVVGFCVNPFGSRVVLIEKTKPDWQKGFLNGVGGKIEEGENPLEAMVREFKEETDCLIENWIPFAETAILAKGADLEDENAERTYIDIFYTVAEPAIKTITEEKVDWYPIEYLDTLKTLPSISWLVPMALDRIYNPNTFEYGRFLYREK